MAAWQDQVLTANRLRDGEVVYWTGVQWQASLSDAEVFATKDAAQAALAAADQFVQDRIVVNTYLFDVRHEGGRLHPVEEREVIRAAGPTVRRDVGKQARHVSL